MEDILTFTKPETRWLSNMTYVNIYFDGILYPSTENFYQAMKYSDQSIRRLISKMTPYDAKKYSREHPMTHAPMESASCRIRVMTYAQRQKYVIDEFQQKLLLTGNCHIEEGNWWNDKFWGTDIKTREGENNLGKIIMNLRKEIQDNIQKEAFRGY